MTTQINQTSGQAIINWNGFSIDVNELVRFVQPGADAVALNKVIGADPSAILGQMIANGSVFLVNPNGVLFAPGSSVDVGSLLATTFDINNDDFMAGRYNFAQADGAASSSVVNKGQIKVADNGFVFLVAPGVGNEGLIIANLGKVALGAGNSMTVDFDGNNLISYEVSGKVLENVIGPDGAPMSSLVRNSGTISANGGKVLLTGDAAKDIVSSVVNQDGIIEAKSLVGSGGSVKLIGRGEGIVQNSGTIDVSAAEAGAAAGGASLSGEYAGNFGEILARGATDADGGNVKLESEKMTLVSSAGVIDASGADNSSGGKIILLSDGYTAMSGATLARGGDSGGDGGFIEISSQGGLSYTGLVDALAPEGNAGTLLIDPKNVIIAAAGAATLAQVDQFSDTPAADATIAVATINGAGANVVIQANNDITVDTAVNMAGAGIGLTLQGGRSININDDITTNDGAVTIKANDEAAAAFVANRDAGAGSITMASGATIDAGSSNVGLTIGTLGTAGASPLEQ
jgi:filamentous hemagglutinin family protein